MDPHPGLPGGSFGASTWTLPDGAVVRRIEERDIESLRAWRNSQQAVLRQQAPLDSDHQAAWFANRVDPSYGLPHPSEILVVVTEADRAVSYGGLTNIEWTSHRAELSFLAATERTRDPAAYAAEFSRFLRWVTSYTFEELALNRIFTETWEDRTAHIELLEDAGFELEGRMRQHVVKDGEPRDALLHGLLAGRSSNDEGSAT